jgi:phage anti-repressor protein
MELNVFESKLGQSVKATELYDFLELAKSQYSRFILKEVLENPYATIEKDYSTCMASNSIAGKKGQFRKEYHLHIDFAKKLCMVSKSKKGNEIRNYLVKLTKQIEENDLLTHEQVIFLSKLKVVFSFISECKKSEQLHLNKHVQESNSKNPYAEFHAMRNKILEIDPATIDERIKLYCIENQRLLPKNKSKTEKLIILDKYEVLRNGVWDYLRATENTQAMKLSNLVKEMAMVEQTTINRVNESNLVNNKVNLPELES